MSRYRVRVPPPPPDLLCRAVANSLVNSAPLVIGIDDRVERRNLTKYVFTVSRALIGNELADGLKYPSTLTFGVLASFRLQERYKVVLASLSPKRAENSSFTRFTSLLEETGISYRLPEHVYAEEDRQR